jgi:hypothetical protein
MRSQVAVKAGICFGALFAICVPVSATADDAPAPAANAACAPRVADAWTYFVPPGSHDLQTFRCVQAPAGTYQWKPATFAFPIRRMFTYGPMLILGEPAYPGHWIGTPLADDTHCVVEQYAMLRTRDPAAFPPPPIAGRAGDPVSFDIWPTTSQLRLSGHCLWGAIGQG